MSTEDFKEMVSHGTVKVSHLLTGIGCFVAGMSLALAVHSQLVIPAIMGRVIPEIDSRIRTSLDLHEGRPHTDAVDSGDLQHLTEALRGLATKESLTLLSERLRRIEERQETILKELGLR